MQNSCKILYFALLSLVLGSEPFADYKIGKDYFINKIDSDISIDGLMAEDVWSEIDSINDYKQDFPYNNEDPSFKTEVKMFYNDKGIYVYARMFDDQPDKIQKRLAKRDDLDNGFWESSDWIMFSFDSRHDHQTGYIFAVNASGIKADAMIYDDADYDIEYNSLWYAETNIDDLGWTVEMLIPFSSFRFDSEMGSKWGFNTKRYIYRLNEINSWVSFPLETKGVSSKFGHLIGLSGIKDYKTVEFKPFISMDRGQEKESKLITDSFGYIIDGYNKNNFENILNNNNIGFDLKYNINTYSVIDISINPDFGQVEVDPADINISYYETYLNEKRPFFIENATMFTLPIEMFYSRRIGEVKDINYNIRIPTYIDIAAKVSGKEFNGFSYGLIAASTHNEIPDTVNFNPQIPDDNQYYLVRLKQDLFDGNSFIGLSATSFTGLRGNYRLSQDSQGNAIINQYYSQNYFFKSSTYSIDGVFNFFDNRLYSDFQMAYSESNKSGYAYSFQSIYDINRFWSINMDIESIDDDFDSNDIGYIYRNDIDSKEIKITYQDLSPNLRFQERYFGFGIDNKKNNSNSIRLNSSLFLNVGALMKNNSYMSIALSKSYNSFNDRLLYDYKQDELGVEMFVPSGYGGYINWDSDSRQINSYSIGLGWGTNKIDDWGYNFRFNYVHRPDYNLKLGIDYEFYKSKEKYHWLDIIGSAEDPHYIFCNSNNELQKLTFRFDAFLNREITLQSYAEIIQTDNIFDNWMELEPGDLYPKETAFSTGIGTYAEENVNPAFGQTVNPNNDIYFFSKYTEIIYNLVLRWEVSPESEFYFVYTRYWLANGKKINHSWELFDERTYQLDDTPWVESSFDQGISIKYTRQFNL